MAGALAPDETRELDDWFLRNGVPQLAVGRGVEAAAPPLDRIERINLAVALLVTGGFASLYFSAVALGDARNREAFLDDVLERLRRIMAAWSYYRGALGA